MAATTGAPQANGVPPRSAFISHLLQYPLISDGLSSVKQNMYGQQAIVLSLTAYEKVAKLILPYVSPCLTKPYKYVAPCIKKADEIGDRTLSTLEQCFPAVRKPAAEFYQETKDLVLFPVRKALISTVVIVSTETVSLVHKIIETLKVQTATAATLAPTPVTERRSPTAATR